MKQPPTIKRPNRALWIVLGIFCFIGLLICGTGLYFVVTISGDIRSSAVRAEEVAEDYKAAGLPWTLADMSPDPPVPDDQNAAPLIQNAIEAFDDTLAKSNGEQLDQAIQNQDWNQVANLIEPHQKALAIALVASNKPRADFNRDWDLGPNLLFPELASIKAFCRLLTTTALLEQSKGNQDQAVKLLEASHKLAQIPGNDPTVIAYLVEVACQSITYRGYERCASLAAQTNQPVTPYSDSLMATVPTASFVHSLKGEAYTTIAVTRNIGDVNNGKEAMDSYPTDPALLIRDGIPKNEFSRASMTRFMEYWLDVNKTINRHDGDLLTLGKELDKLEEGIQATKPSSILLAILIPVYSSAGEAEVRLHATHITTLAYLHALEYKSETGSFPKTMSDLSETYIDPFSNQPLKIATVDGSFRIYSVGQNQLDDGGKTRKELGVSSADKDPAGDLPVPTPN